MAALESGSTTAWIPPPSFDSISARKVVAGEYRPNT